MKAMKLLAALGLAGILVAAAVIYRHRWLPAEEVDGNGAGSNWGTISELYVDAAGTVVRLKFSRRIANPAGCEGADFYVRELDDSVASQRFLDVLVAAHMHGRKVKFWIEGCSPSRWWDKTRPHIVDVYVSD